MVEALSKKPFEGLKQLRKVYKDKVIPLKNFRDEEIRQFRELNEKLAKLEETIVKEYKKLYFFAQKKVTNKDDLLCCFDMGIYVYFFLDAKHPAYNKESDNILTVLYANKENQSWKFGIGDGLNHNTIPNRDATFLEHDKHCYLMHSLYDHTDLHYKELLAIGEFDFQIRFTLNYDVEDFYNFQDKN